jgi:hypothetical protein
MTSSREKVVAHADTATKLKAPSNKTGSRPQRRTQRVMDWNDAKRVPAVEVRVARPNVPLAKRRCQEVLSLIITTQETCSCPV